MDTFGTAGTIVGTENLPPARFFHKYSHRRLVQKAPVIAQSTQAAQSIPATNALELKQAEAVDLLLS